VTSHRRPQAYWKARKRSSPPAARGCRRSCLDQEHRLCGIKVGLVCGQHGAPSVLKPRRVLSGSGRSRPPIAAGGSRGVPAPGRASKPPRDGRTQCAGAGLSPPFGSGEWMRGAVRQLTQCAGAGLSPPFGGSRRNVGRESGGFRPRLEAAARYAGCGATAYGERHAEGILGPSRCASSDRTDVPAALMPGDHEHCGKPHRRGSPEDAASSGLESRGDGPVLGRDGPLAHGEQPSVSSSATAVFLASASSPVGIVLGLPP
jgi:hypothetical protein